MHNTNLENWYTSLPRKIINNERDIVSCRLGHEACFATTATTDDTDLHSWATKHIHCGKDD